MAAKAWTASGVPSAPVSSASPRSNQTCACAEPSCGGADCSAGRDAREPERWEAPADEVTAAMAIAAPQRILASLTLTALSPPSDLNTPILSLGDARIGRDREIRLALGQHLESVRRNAAVEQAFQHGCGAALRKFKIFLR